MHWTCPKCSCSLEMGDTPVVFCPYCGVKTTEDSVSSKPGSNVYEEEADKHENSQLPSPTCPVCCCEILPEEDRISCPDCGMLYHKDCWEDNKGCAIFGCKSAQCLDVHLNQKTASAEDAVSCPWCHSSLSPKIVKCPFCGNRTGKTSAVCFSYASVREKALVPIENNLRLLWPDVVTAWKRTAPYLRRILGTYRMTITRYADFRGTENRTVFFGFLAVSVLIFLILLTIPGSSYLVMIYMAVTICPTLAVMTRRLHDTGLSGWFLCAVPVLPLLLCVRTLTQAEKSLNEKKG